MLKQWKNCIFISYNIIYHTIDWLNEKHLHRNSISKVLMYFTLYNQYYILILL